MPGRSYQAGSGSYRYSINGQEKSTEIDANGNITTAQFWEYDSRIGRRWNLDPKPTVSVSGYSAFLNNPIWHSDPLGDTPRVVRGAGGVQVGQQFSFTNDGTIGDGSQTDGQFLKMQRDFRANLQARINGSASPAGTVTFNDYDPLATVTQVTFGATGVSNANMQTNSMYISQQDMPNANNTASHEWLHTAGLMDRSFDIYGFNNNNGRGLTINPQRSDNTPMQNLPLGYDPQYIPGQNIMSVAGNQITDIQWDIVFSGVSERSKGCLGVVSLLVSNPHIGPPGSSYYQRILNSTSRMAFSANQAFTISNTGGVLLQRPFVAGANPAPSHYIIHGMDNSPNTYAPNAPFLSNPNNRTAVDNFRR